MRRKDSRATCHRLRFAPNFEKLPYKHWEMPLFFVLSGGCGVLGGAYVKLFKAIVDGRRSCAALEADDYDGLGFVAAAVAKRAVGSQGGKRVMFSHHSLERLL